MFDKNETAMLKIDGMSCKHCVMRIEEAVKGLKGVKKVAVDLNQSVAKIVYEVSKISLDTITKQIE